VAPAVIAAGEERFHSHDLRHFAATRLDEQGMGGKLRTEIIGHADERITNCVYMHIGRARLSAAASSFDPLSDAVVDQRQMEQKAAFAITSARAAFCCCY